uniref:FAD-binding protein n=1 Tax=Trichocoleus desertorum TaxID=1481672 RepID=UPI0025B59BE7|nr:FAD-binding protein [Trichocoleus desertorum]
MRDRSSRRIFLQGLLASTAIIGFDVVSRGWVTAVSAQSNVNFAKLPPLDGAIYTDEATRQAAADDFGHIVHRQPIAVLKPGSKADIVNVVQFARTHKLKIAARGQGHSSNGQAQVEAGIVIDMSTLNQIIQIGADRAEVEGGVVWLELLQAAIAQGLTPPVLTDYLELSIGGTLSAGGIGGATHRYGVQVDQVLALEVVTGQGTLETCSPTQNKTLFEAVLAGLGQCGIIVQATVRLIPAKQQARVFLLFYDDLATFTQDQRLLISEERFNYLEGQVVPTPNGGWRYMIEAVSFYTPLNEPNNAALLAGLSYQPGSEQITDPTYFDFANRLAPVVETLKSIGVWSFPHPWLNLFVPGSKVDRFVGEVVSTLTLADTGQGPILLYPVKTWRFTRPLFRTPRENIAFLFAILRTAPPDPTVINQMVAANRDLFERDRALGGYRYPVGTVPMTPADWKQHFQPVWGKLVSAKQRYDPDNILAPGQGIFV